jgi:hypothetical protein
MVPAPEGANLGMFNPSADGLGGGLGFAIRRLKAASSPLAVMKIDVPKAPWSALQAHGSLIWTALVPDLRFLEPTTSAIGDRRYSYSTPSDVFIRTLEGSHYPSPCSP